jgi:hypothetical protein
VRLLVSMGVRDRAGGPLRAELAVLDPDRGVLETRRVVVRERAGPTAHQELTCACLDRDGLVVQPAHTELLWIDPTSLGVVRRASHPLFHGVHSAAVRPADGAIAVTCAGTESVLVLSPAGELLAHHFLRPQPFAAAYPGIDDFRTVDHDGFKPHSHHPNHAEWWGDELWVTCFETQDCTAIPTGRRIPLTGGIPHDGRLRDGLFWFTQVTGRVVAVDPASSRRAVELEVVAAAGDKRRPGWCRGVEVAAGRLFVGFSTLRSTRHREVLRTLLFGEAGEKSPARVTELDPGSGAVLREHVVGNEHGGTIYGVLVLPA